MADITKCKGTNCPVASKCRRFTATPSNWQSYFTEVPLKDGKCDMYWGEKNDLTMDQLKDILKPKEDNDGI